MDGVTVDNFETWDASAARRRVLSNDIMTSVSVKKISLQTSGAVKTEYIITIPDSTASYDTLTDQLEDGLASGMLNS